MSDHLIAEAHRHAMALPTTNPTHEDLAWYVREVSEITTERDQLRAEVRAVLKIVNEQTARAEEAEHEADQLKDGLRDSEAALALNTLCAERAEAELAKAKAILASIEEDGTEEHNAAVRLRQELATERARLDWLVVSHWNSMPASRAAIDAAMKEGTK